MVIGITLMRLSGGTYYSPEFPRGGLAAEFSLETLGFSPGAGLNWVIERRNRDDTSYAVLVPAVSINTLTVTPISASGIKELVRYAYVVTGANPSDAAHFNPLAPAWRPS